MVLDLECQLRGGGSWFQDEDQKAGKNFQHNYIMKRIESLKKNSHFEKILKNRVINNNLFSIYCVKNFLKNSDSKKLYISFVMKKKIGNAVKRNRIKRKLRSSVQKLLKINSAININNAYIIFAKSKVYEENSDRIFMKMKNSFKEIKV